MQFLTWTGRIRCTLHNWICGSDFIRLIVAQPRVFESLVALILRMSMWEALLWWRDGIHFPKMSEPIPNQYFAVPEPKNEMQIGRNMHSCSDKMKWVLSLWLVILYLFLLSFRPFRRFAVIHPSNLVLRNVMFLDVDKNQWHCFGCVHLHIVRKTCSFTQSHQRLRTSTIHLMLRSRFFYVREVAPLLIDANVACASSVSRDANADTCMCYAHEERMVKENPPLEKWKKTPDTASAKKPKWECASVTVTHNSHGTPHHHPFVRSFVRLTSFAIRPTHVCFCRLFSNNLYAAAL